MKKNIKVISDRKQWDAFLLNYGPYTFFQNWEWGDIQHENGNKYWRFGIFDDFRCIGIFQISKISARRGTFLHIRHGPVFIDHTQDNWKIFIDFCTKLAKDEGAIFFRCSPLIDDTDDHKKLFLNLNLRPSPIHALDGESSWVLDIKPNEDELLAGMRKSTRYDIRRSFHMPIRIIKDHGTKLLPEFMELYRKTATRQGFVPHKDIASEVKYFSKRNNSLTLLGLVDGNPTASAIITYSGQQAIYRHGASVPSSYPVSHRLQWEAILEAKKRSISLYNFWGIAHINNKKHKWAGITTFKTGFGGRSLMFIHAHDYPVSKFYIKTYLIENIRKILQGY